jgi:hypothetical protein
MRRSRCRALLKLIECRRGGAEPMKPSFFSQRAFLIRLTAVTASVCLTPYSAAFAADAASKNPPDRYKTYSVLEIGKAGVPRLTRVQLDWMNRIHCTPAYAKAWRHLRFATIVNYAVTPLTVYDGRDVLLDLPSGAHVIGAPCDYVFDPFRVGTIALPPDLCAALDGPPVSKTNCAKPSFEPRRSERKPTLPRSRDRPTATS